MQWEIVVIVVCLCQKLLRVYLHKDRLKQVKLGQPQVQLSPQMQQLCTRLQVITKQIDQITNQISDFVFCSKKQREKIKIEKQIQALKKQQEQANQEQIKQRKKMEIQKKAEEDKRKRKRFVMKYVGLAVLHFIFVKVFSGVQSRQLAMTDLWPMSMLTNDGKISCFWLYLSLNMLL